MRGAKMLLAAVLAANLLATAVGEPRSLLRAEGSTSSSASARTLLATYTASAPGQDCTGTDLQSCYGYGQYRVAGQGTYAGCAQFCDACSGCTGFGISNNGCWLKKTTGLTALANSVCYRNLAATTTPSSPPPSTAVVVYTSAGSGLDCTGADLQSCYGYGQYSIAGQGTYAFCAQSCTACSGCTGFGISNNGCWLKKTTGTKALANSVCYLAPSAAVAAVASPPPPPPAVVYTSAGSGLDCTGTDLQSCYGYGQYSIAGQGTYAFCAQSCTACSGCTGFGISNNGCWLKKTTGTKALANSVCYLAPSAVPPPVASPPPTRPPPPPTVVYQSAGSNVDCSGLDLQSCYGYGQYSIAGQGTYAFCAQSCTACNGCTGFGISNNGCWLKKTSGIHALTNSQCWLAPSAMAALPSPSPPPPPPSPSPPPPPSPSPPPPPSPSPPPPPTIYTSQHVLDAAASSGFTGKVIGGPTTHVINNDATTSSTETTASGKQNVWETTSTSDATQQGLGNGQTLSKSSTSSTTDTDHQLTFKKVNVHSSTTDIDGKPADVPTAPPLCGGTPFAVANTMKQLCLHVKGGINNGGFVVANVKRPVITAACSQGSPNQQFTWLPAPEGGMLMHDATKQVLALTSATVTNGAAVILAPASDALTEEWVWNNPTTGGTLSAMADPYFQITDSQVNANVAVGLPVHMWHLASSLPSGQPKAAWMASCDK